MGILAKRSQKEFTLHPEGGPFPAVISKLVAHEQVQTQYGPKNRLQIIFETKLMARDHVDGIEDERPMTISVFVNNNLNKGSRLLSLVEQQVPKDRLDQLFQELKEGIDIEKLLVGSQWLIMVEQTETNGKTYANVASTMRAPAEQQVPVWDGGRLPF